MTQGTFKHSLKESNIVELIWFKCANFSEVGHYSPLGWQQSSQTLSDHHLDQHFQSLPGILCSASRRPVGYLLISAIPI